MNKLANVINSLSEKELMLIKRDLVAGNIDRLIEFRLQEAQNMSFDEKTCPVCGGEITNNSLVLEFGEDYLRKRAFFDGVDCLEYFASTKLKKKHNNEPEFANTF